jgi:hypothetical protein
LRSNKEKAIMLQRVRILSVMLFIAGGLVLSAGEVGAHGASVGPKGGQQVHAGPLHQEMLIEGNRILFNIYTMQDAPVTTAGAKGSATILQDGQAISVALLPLGENSLSGVLPRPLSAGARIVTDVALAGKGAIQARYTIK